MLRRRPDPIGDLAILGPPDSQEFFHEAEAYDRFVSAAPELTIADVGPDKPVRGKVHSLCGQWLSCVVRHYGGPLWLQEPTRCVGVEDQL